MQLDEKEAGISSSTVIASKAWLSLRSLTLWVSMQRLMGFSNSDLYLRSHYILERSFDLRLWPSLTSTWE